MMNDHQLDFPELKFKRWFEGLPRPMQVLYGIPILMACFGVVVYTGVEMYQASQAPEEQPKQAIWVTLILFVVSIVLNELLRPKPNLEDARPAGLGDFQVPTTTEGRVVPIIWGKVRQRGPNVIWYGDLGKVAITERVKTGLWSSETITKGFRYNLGLQMAICRGSNVRLRKVWIGDDTVFTGTVSTNTTFDIDEPELFGGDELGSGGLQSTVEFYIGSTTQPISTYLDDPDRQRITTAATQTAPRYTGTSHVVVRGLNDATRGAYVGNSSQIKAWSFEVDRFPGIFSGQGSGEDSIGDDCNPVNVIYEILTNNEWGFGFPSTDIDVGFGSSFLSAADTCITEANGFSMILDRQMTAKELLGELQRQIDGVVYLKQSTGKWSIKLARDDYDIDLVPQLTDDNVDEVRDYTRGAWEDTTNTITVQFDKRDDDYKQSFALAQDMANAMIQGDGTPSGAQATSGKLAFPGVKSSALASNIAWRELRGQSYPLARCQLVVNRQMWDVAIGDVVAWTNTQLGYTKLPMRVTRVDYGRLTSNRMTLTVVQDVFKFAAASMGTPPATGWVPPSVTLAAYPSDEQTAFESPLAILTRDPSYGGDPNISKVWAGVASQDVGEVAFDITQRNSSGTPGGSYADAGTIVSFLKIGELNSALTAGVANPTSAITVKPEASSQTEIESAFVDATTLSDMGVDLVQLIKIGNEFMLVKSASINASNVDLETVYRGVLDSAQSNHAANDDVFLLFVGGGLTTTSFPTTNNVDIELRMKTGSERFAGAVTKIGLTMDKRAIRPYPPAALLYNGSGTAFNTPDLEDNGSGENGQQFAVDWWRRIWGPADEVAAMTSDTDPATHPDVSNPEYRVRVFVDPDGVNTEIASSPFAWAAGSGTVQVPRNEILDIAAAGTEIRVEVETRHDIFAETQLTSRHDLIHDVTPTSVNDGLFYLGGNINTGPSNAFVVAAAGIHTVDVASAPSAGNVEYRINGGAWNTVTPGGTATASLSISDTIEVRQSSSGATPNANFVWIDNPSATRVAYGCI